MRAAGEMRTVLVTGGAGGIGYSIAQAFGQLGDNVHVNDVSHEAADAATQRLRSAGIQAHSLPADVSDPDAAAAAVSRVEETSGGVDVLVNCAALVAFAAIADTLTMPAEGWRRVLDVNLSGAFYFSQATARGMVARGSGSIINISSISGIVAEENAVAYCASKAGLLGLTRALALDLARHGVRVNAVAPGSINTERAREAIVKPTYRFEKTTPLGVGRPEDVASAAVFLASEEARFITGATFIIDGGATIY